MRVPDHIRLVHTGLQDLEPAQAALSGDERRLQATFRLEQRRHSFALGRLAARRAVSALQCVPPESVALQIASDGAVDVVGADCHVSITHSGDRVMAAAAVESVGIDLERVQVRPSSLFRFMLHPEEAALPNRLDLDPDDSVALFWSIKESVLKARRSGLRMSPKNVRILRMDVDQADIRVSESERWTVRFSLSDGYAFALAHPAPVSATRNRT